MKKLHLILVLVGVAGSAHAAVAQPATSGDKAPLQIVSWNWLKLPDHYGPKKAAVEVVVQVMNKTDRNIGMAQLEFSTFDRKGKIVSTDVFYADAIPAGGSRAAGGYMASYGTETVAKVDVIRVNFSDGNR